MERVIPGLLENGPMTVAAIVAKLVKAKYLPRATNQNILSALEANPDMFTLSGDEWSLKKYAPISGHSLPL